MQSSSFATPARTPLGHAHPLTHHRVSLGDTSAARHAGVAGESKLAAVASVPSSSSSTSSSSPFELGSAVDARDGMGKWLPAAIVDVDDRGPFRPGRTSPYPWETDESGQWQPKGGVALKIHFNGFAPKWDEYIHSACWLPSTSAPIDPSIRPRLAPLHSLSSPDARQRAASATSAQRPTHGLRVNDPIEVEVHLPVEENTPPGRSPLHPPSFKVRWLPAVILAVDHDQLHIRYEPPVANKGQFRFPIWFHVALGEVRRLGAVKPIGWSPEKAAAAHEAAAAARAKKSAAENHLTHPPRTTTDDVEPMSASSAAATRRRREVLEAEDASLARSSHRYSPAVALPTPSKRPSVSTPTTASTPAYVSTLSRPAARAAASPSVTPQGPRDVKLSPFLASAAATPATSASTSSSIVAPSPSRDTRAATSRFAHTIGSPGVASTGAAAAVATPSSTLTTPSQSLGSALLSSLANLRLLGASSSSSGASVDPYAVGQLVDVRSIEDGLWSEAKVIANRPAPSDQGAQDSEASGQQITVKLMDRNTTQLVESVDVPYMLARHHEYSAGEISPRFELGDRVEITLHTASRLCHAGYIDRFRQGQILVKSESDEYWVNPKCDHVTWIARGKVDRRRSGRVGEPTIASPITSPTRQAHGASSQSTVASSYPLAPPALDTVGALVPRYPNTAPLPPAPLSPPSAAAIAPSPGLFGGFFPSFTSALSPSSAASPSVGSAHPPSSPNTTLAAPPNPFPAFYAQLVRRSLRAPLRVPVGMANLGNSCYISAGLQCLAGLSPLIQYFVLDGAHRKVLEARALHAKESRRLDAMRGEILPSNFGHLTMEFAQLLSDLYTGAAGSRLFPDKLKRCVTLLANDAGVRFRGQTMQDAHEFMAVVFNALHSELNQGKERAPSPLPAKKLDEPKSLEPPPPIDPELAAHLHWSAFQRTNTDPISHLFYCQSAQYVVCSACRHHSCSHHVIGQLTLDIPHVQPPASKLFSSFRSPQSGGPVTLQQCLSTQLGVAELEDYFCSRCRAKHAAKSAMYFTTLPPLLLVQLKRFDAIMQSDGAFGQRGGGKDETPCAYPLELDVAFLLKPSQEIVSRLVSPPYLADSKTTGSRYRLKGVVLHHEDHYTALTPTRDEPPEGGPKAAPSPGRGRGGRTNWRYFNDSKIYLAEEEDVLNQQQHVYLLMYQRIDDEDSSE